MGSAVGMGADGDGGVPRRFPAAPIWGSRRVPRSPASRPRAALPSSGEDRRPQRGSRGRYAIRCRIRLRPGPLPAGHSGSGAFRAPRAGMRAAVRRAEAPGPRRPRGGTPPGSGLCGCGTPRGAEGCGTPGPPHLRSRGRSGSVPLWGPWEPLRPTPGDGSGGTELRPHPSRHRRTGGGGAREEPGTAPPGAPTPHPRRKAADRGRLGWGGGAAPPLRESRGQRSRSRIPVAAGAPGPGLGPGAVPPAAMGRGRAAA